MAETNISGITAPIYTADLLYEQQCKCGKTRILFPGDEFIYDAAGASDVNHKAWKIEALGGAPGVGANSLDTITMDGLAPADATALANETQTNPKASGWEIKGLFTQVNCATGMWIVYFDCNNS